MDFSTLEWWVEHADHAHGRLGDDPVAVVFVEAVHDPGLELMCDAGVELFQHAFALDDVIRLNMVRVPELRASPGPKRMSDKVKPTPSSSSRKRRVTARPPLSMVSFLVPARPSYVLTIMFELLSFRVRRSVPRKRAV